MKAVSFLWFAIALSACSYQFSEDKNFKVIPAPATKLVTIDLDEVGADTLFVYEPVNLKYSVTGLIPAEVKFLTLELVNTAVVYGMTDLSGTVTLVPPANTIGLFQLRLTVYSKSGSGSYADKVGAETILYQKEWPVTVNTLPPDPLPITAITRANGSLKIEWEKYDLAKFASYVFTRTTANSYEEFIINDPDSNFYFDEKFLGGDASYGVRLVTDGGAIPVAGPLTNYTDTTTAHLVSVQMVNSNQSVKLTWSRGRYPANVKRFEVRVGDDPNFSNGTLIHDSQVITDTTVTIPAVLGTPLYCFVRSSPYDNVSAPNDPDHIIKKSNYRSGEVFGAYDEIRFSSPAGRFYTLSPTHLTAYDIADCSVINTYPLTASSDQYKFEVTVAGDKVVVVEAHNRLAVVYDAVTFLPLSQFDLSTEIPPADIVWTVAPTQANEVYITKTHLTPSGPGQVNKPALVVYDLATGSLVKIIDQDPLLPLGQFVVSGGQSRLSPDNQFIYFESQVNFGNGAIAKIQSDMVVASVALGWPLPDASDANQVLNAIYLGNKIGVFDWTSLSYVNVIDTYADFNPTDFVPELNLVIGYRGTIGTVFDYSAQQTLYSIEAGGFPLSLEGNYLYSTWGARIKIN